MNLIFKTITVYVHSFKKRKVSCIPMKGVLISESFSLWLKSPNKGAKSLEI